MIKLPISSYSYPYTCPRVGILGVFFMDELTFNGSVSCTMTCFLSCLNTDVCLYSPGPGICTCLSENLSTLLLNA